MLYASLVESPMRPTVAVARTLLTASIAVIIAVIIAVPAAASAQRGPVPSSTDSVGTAEGVRDARAAAARRSVAGNATAGFFGGVALGFFGAFALAEHATGPGSGAVAGLTLLVAATEGGDTAPSPELARIALRHGPAYERAFRAEHVARLRARRRRAGLLGALGGATVGALVLVSVLGHVD